MPKDGKSLEPVGEINPLKRQEIQTVLKTAAGGKYLYHYPLFLCAPRTGIREGELVALKGIDVDFNGGFIHVQRTYPEARLPFPRMAKPARLICRRSFPGC